MKTSSPTSNIIDFMYDKQFQVLHEEEFIQPVPSQCQEMVENRNIFMDPQKIQYSTS